MNSGIFDIIGKGLDTVDQPSNQTNDLFKQAARLRGEATGAPPQMHGPSQLMYLLAALAQGLDPKGNIGANFLGGFNQAAGLRFQNDQTQYQARQQQKLGLAEEADKQAARQREEERYQAEGAYKRMGDQREDQTKRYLGQLAYDRTLDKSKADNETKKAIAEMRDKTVRERIAASLQGPNSQREARWIAVLNNPQTAPEMKVVAFAALRKLNPAVYGELSPDEMQRAIEASPAILRLTEEKIRSEQNKHDIQAATLKRYAMRNRLDEAHARLLEKDVEHYDDKLKDKAADLWSRIRYRDQMLKQGEEKVGIARQNAWSLQNSRDQGAARMERGAELSRNKAIAGLERANINAILKRHEGKVPGEDDEDYTPYMISVQRLENANQNIRDLGKTPGAKAGEKAGSQAGQAAGAGITPATVKAPQSSVSNDYKGIEGFARQQGFHVTSGLASGGHNPGSKHYTGQAVDVSVRNKSPEEIRRFIKEAQAQGFKVRDERTQPAGQAVWTGPHLHLEKASGAPQVARPEASQQRRTRSGNKYRFLG